METLLILYELQKHKCAICEKELNLHDKSTHVDHNHENNQLRGILCKGCNHMLGCAQDISKTLLNGVKYLQNPPAKFLYENSGEKS